jgi:hypothetical protein
MLAARAQGGTSARRTGAALSFVSFIPLFDCTLRRASLSLAGPLGNITFIHNADAEDTPAREIGEAPGM